MASLKLEPGLSFRRQTKTRISCFSSTSTADRPRKSTLRLQARSQISLGLSVVHEAGVALEATRAAEMQLSDELEKERLKFAIVRKENKSLKAKFTKTIEECQLSRRRFNQGVAKTRSLYRKLKVAERE